MSLAPIRKALSWKTLTPYIIAKIINISMINLHKKAASFNTKLVAFLKSRMGWISNFVITSSYC